MRVRNLIKLATKKGKQSIFPLRLTTSGGVCSTSAARGGLNSCSWGVRFGFCFLNKWIKMSRWEGEPDRAVQGLLTVSDDWSVLARRGKKVLSNVPGWGGGN